MNDFLAAYIEAALWSSNDPDSGEPLDRADAELAPETLATMEKDCDDFIMEAGHLISTYDASRAGHDFWLTRNGHGAGFWDGDWEETQGDQLTAICEGYGHVDLYVYRGQIHAV